MEQPNQTDKERTRQITEQMNGDMFDRIERAHYHTKHFSEMDVKQARESFIYNGYKVFASDNVISVTKQL